MTEIKDLLFEILIILFPVFFYHMFLAERYKEKNSKQKKIVVTALAAFTMVICMSFPLYLIPGYRHDLRHVALLFGILYGGGYVPGIILTIILIAFRFYLGSPPGTYNSILVVLLIVPVIFVFYQRFLQGNRIIRTKIAVLLAVYMSFVIITVASTKNEPIPTLQFCILGFFISLSSWVIVFMIENLRENQRLQIEVQTTEKLRVLGELTSSFAHEIRNPMQVNRGFLQLLGESKIPEELKRYVQISIEEMDRANEIVSDYLAFAKPELDEINPVDITKLLGKVSNIMSSYAHMYNVELSVNCHCEAVSILANEQKIKQCLINIVKNGIESMSQGGSLEMNCDTKEDEAVITISDQGIGMTEEQIKRLGSPFYSLKEKGTGLGLMVSYRIITAFNGRISVKSAEGKGTIFIISIPKYI
jgi:two-component system sporulation sensor kinase B